MIKGHTLMEQGFRLLMEKYQEKLYWQVRRILYHHEDANDVLQNSFIKVYNNIQNFEGKSKLYTWMYRIVTNEAITYLNKRNKKNTASLDDQTNNLSIALESDPYYDGVEIQRILVEAIAMLPEKQRLVFNLRYFDELSYADMSDLVGTSEGALKASFHHAVKKIERFITRVATI